ncbi:hypothetical protein MAR_023472 [Mya arenaria]|uniref:Uncharacterized protein n=1 Tax=Mya arenaria TaxID=6604 RepID=A0ABY7DNY4_MYAAR|nr:hypothetical protein MAR_023472 [Mya arenaria]
MRIYVSLKLLRVRC